MPRRCRRGVSRSSPDSLPPNRAFNSAQFCPRKEQRSAMARNNQCLASKRPRLTDLPHEVLVSVMQLSGQPARMQSMLACKTLHAASTEPGVAREAASFGADTQVTAVNYCLRHGCKRVEIVGAAPDDVVWFLRELARRGGDEIVNELDVRFDAIDRLPEAFLATVALHKGLRRLSVRVKRCQRVSDASFPTRSTCDLESIEFYEGEDAMESKHIVLWFGSTAQFPRLHSLHVHVSMSDALKHVPTYPNLRTASYSYDLGDGIEDLSDVKLRGCKFDELRLVVDELTDFSHLLEQLSDCEARRLILDVYSDSVEILLDTRLRAVEYLVINAEGRDVHVYVEYPVLRTYDRLKRFEFNSGRRFIDDEGEQCSHVLHLIDLASCDSYVDLVNGGAVIAWSPRAHLQLSLG